MQISLTQAHVQTQRLEQKQELRLAPQNLAHLAFLEAPADEMQRVVSAEADVNPLAKQKEIPGGCPECTGDVMVDGEAEIVLPERRPRRLPTDSCPADATQRKSAWLESQPAPLESRMVLREETAFIEDEELATAYGELVDHLDPDGFLRTPLVEIAAASGCGVEELEQARELLAERCPGLGSAGRQEFMLAQLDRIEDDTPGLELARRMLKECWRLGSLEQTARALGADLAAIREAAGLISTRLLLSPAETSREDDGSQSAMPDAEVVLVDGRAVVDVSPVGGVSLLSADEFCAKNGIAADEGVQAFLLQQERTSRGIFEGVERRGHTLQRVIQFVLDRQNGDFLLTGWVHHRAVTQSEAAVHLGLNPSTVCRAVGGKYVRLPFCRSLVPLSELFSPAACSGSNSSMRAVRQIVADLIDHEEPSAPLSDARIGEFLAELHGVRLNVRTVCNQRSALGLPSARERRRWFSRVAAA